MSAVSQGSRTPLTGARFTVTLPPSVRALVDLTALLLGDDRRVGGDEDFVFFNNPSQPGVQLTDDGLVVDLAAVPARVSRILVTGSTEAQDVTVADVPGLAVTVAGEQTVAFTPAPAGPETVLMLVAFYRHGGGWKLEAVGQGYAGGLAAYATAHGLDVGGEPAPSTPAPVPAAPAAAPGAPLVTPPTAPSGRPVSLEKVKVVITKDSPTKTAKIDLRKNLGEAGWVLTVGLEWDGRGASYDRDGTLRAFGRGDLDVYFFCRDEQTNRYVVLSGEHGRQGSLDAWPFIRHGGDCLGPGHGGKPASEQVVVRPSENGQLLVNVYQSVDNGTGAIDTFGRPRAVIRYGRAGADGLPGPDADEIVVVVGNGKNSYWATVASIDVVDGVLHVDGETRYSRSGSEHMPCLDSNGRWTRSMRGGPEGRSKSRYGEGLDRYSGVCG